MVKGSNFKVGVATRKCNLEFAFSDCEWGWAYYNSGYLRHNSGGDGPKYGEAYKEGDVIGVYLDLIDGRIFFSKEGKVFPVAYEDKKLLDLEIYPACCTLSKDECY